MKTLKYWILLALFSLILSPFFGCLLIGVFMLPDIILNEPIGLLGRYSIDISSFLKIDKNDAVYLVLFGPSFILNIIFIFLGGKDWIKVTFAK